MIVGFYKEIKKKESRVILTPIEVAQLTARGHKVLLGSNAGVDSGFKDEDYIEVGAEIRETMQEIYDECDFIVKVKEFETREYNLFKEGQILFSCIHPAGDPKQVDALLDKKVIAFTAEDTHINGSPNSEVAGKLGALMGVFNLLTINGGCGKLVCGATGSPSINALVIGAGIVGKGATEILSSLGANLILMDVDIDLLRQCHEIYPKNVRTVLSNEHTIKNLIPSIDLVVNCVKWPKHRKDHLITRKMLKSMQNGSVIVDISADIGGAIETYRPTTHDNPTYIEEGVIHYGVDNIPGIVPKTISTAYAASVLPHILSIANHGIVEACKKNGYLRRSLTTYKGVLTHKETALIQNRDWKTPEEVLELSDVKNLDNVPDAVTYDV
ncbi:MAG: alanine dehydrogenase [Clostridiales bacterium]|nr:alanine dehydrogenase [Clostridiales bacterium]